MPSILYPRMASRAHRPSPQIMPNGKVLYPMMEAEYREIERRAEEGFRRVAGESPRPGASYFELFR